MRAVEQAMSIIEKALTEGRVALTEVESKALLAAYGIPTTRLGLANNVDEAAEIARSIGYPVAMKIISPDILHKSDVGGVRLDVRSEEEAMVAYEETVALARQARPEARIEGVSVQEMIVETVAEVIVGAKRDPVFGPVILFGLGGVWVDLMRDFSLRVVPFDQMEIAAMVEEIKGYPLLVGYRGSEPADVASLANVISTIARLMEDLPRIVELDLNPVCVRPDGRGAIVADARVLLDSANKS
ncbi:MAG: acetyl-CoA synthetase [Chloroflexota bacterium]|nr:MAG: acetyl-CoA synthetase [Chloroflexota bacterium]